MKNLIYLVFLISISVLSQIHKSEVALKINSAEIVTTDYGNTMKIKLEFINNSCNDVWFGEFETYYPALKKEYAYSYNRFTEDNNCDHYESIEEYFIKDPVKINSNTGIKVLPNSSKLYSFKLNVPSEFCKESEVKNEIQFVYNGEFSKTTGEEYIEPSIKDYVFRGQIKSDKYVVKKQ